MPRLAPLLAALAASASGCWQQSCVEPGGYGDEVCTEYLDGPAFQDWAGPDRCPGAMSFARCADRGFTLECRGAWYKPGSRSAAVHCEGGLTLASGAAPDSPPAAGGSP